MQIVGSTLCMFLVDSAGRRPLLIGGSIACGAALLMLAAADHLHSAMLVVAAMCLFIMSFSASYAGVFWVLLSELFSMGAKAPAASLATAVLFAAGVCGLSVPGGSQSALIASLQLCTACRTGRRGPSNPQA